MRRIGLLANSGKANCRSLLLKAAAYLEQAGCEVASDEATGALGRLGCRRYPDAATLAGNSDLLLVFGGDGTMLRAARDLEGASTPILGINAGGLGFLTAVPSRKMETALRQVVAGEFEPDPRPLIKLTATVDGHAQSWRALNDYVIGRATGSRLIEVDVFVDGAELTRYRCDGLIISSPTGSTAYSLAAGGAIVAPSAEVFTLTPICPHTLSNRSVILSLAVSVEVKALGGRPEIMVSGDGEPLLELRPGQTVKIVRSRRSVNLVRLPGVTFFKTLRHKLDWSGSHV